MGKQESVTLSVSSKQRVQLEKIALDLGFVWGKKPNISAMVKAIASRQLVVTGSPHSEEVSEAIALIQEGIDKLNRIKGESR